MNIKLAALLSVIALCALAVAYDARHISNTASSQQNESTAAHQPAPDFKFTADGKTYDFNRLPQNGIVLHFWASWCVPCLKELPELAAQIQKSEGRLALVAVSIDDKPEAMEKFLKKIHAPQASYIYWVWDENKNISLKLFNTASVPETILINRRRQMVEKIIGDPGWNGEAMSAKFRQLEN